MKGLIQSRNLGYTTNEIICTFVSWFSPGHVSLFDERAIALGRKRRDCQDKLSYFDNNPPWKYIRYHGNKTLILLSRSHTSGREVSSRLRCACMFLEIELERILHCLSQVNLTNLWKYFCEPCAQCCLHFACASQVQNCFAQYRIRPLRKCFFIYNIGFWMWIDLLTRHWGQTWRKGKSDEREKQRKGKATKGKATNNVQTSFADQSAVPLQRPLLLHQCQVSTGALLGARTLRQKMSYPMPSAVDAPKIRSQIPLGFSVVISFSREEWM